MHLDEETGKGSDQFVLVEHGPDVAVELEQDQEHFQADVDFEQGLVGQDFEEISHAEVVRQVVEVPVPHRLLELLVGVLGDLVDLEVLMPRQLHKVVSEALQSVFRATEIVVSED